MKSISCLIWALIFCYPLGVIGGNPFEIFSAPPNSFRSFNSSSQLVLNKDHELISGWKSSRVGNAFAQLFLQKADSLGNLLWEADGTPVCPYPANQENFSMADDGYGGVVVVWEDHRYGAEQPRIFAQRVNLRGETLWGKDGLELCKGGGAQRNPQILADLQGGFFVVWEDFRRNGGEADLFGQHLQLGGKTNWVYEGVPIVTTPGIQQHFCLATDEKRSLYVVWEDFRSAMYWNLYAQKLDATGNLVWQKDGTGLFENSGENQLKPRMVSDGYGGILFVYQKFSEETKGYDIYRGRLNSSAEMVYHLPACRELEDQVNPELVKKGSTIVLAWEDRRNGNWDIYAQMARIYDGQFDWEPNGVPVSTGLTDEKNPVVVTSTAYNYQVVAWLQSGQNGSQVYAQKLDNFGERSWSAGGVILCPLSTEQYEPSVIPDEHGGIFCCWTDRSDPGTTHIFLQHLNRGGLPTIGKGGVRLGANHTASFSKMDGLQVLGSGGIGYYLCWQDFRNGPENPDIYLLKVDTKGKPLWKKSGIPACAISGGQRAPVLVDDGVGGVIVIWVDNRGGSDDNLYAQRFNSEGKYLWKAGGVALCTAPRSQSQIRAISDSKEGVIVCWSDARNLTTTGFDLYLQRVSHDGEVFWGTDGKPLSRFPGMQTAPSIAGDGQGGAFVTWQDNRSGYSNIYLQHVNSYGIGDWEDGGRAVSSQAAHQRAPSLVYSTKSELFICWEDARYGEGNEKIFLQKFTSAGHPVWPGGGGLVCNQAGRQVKGVLKGVNDGNVAVCWLDERALTYAGVKLMAQYIFSNGEIQWDPAGVSIGEGLKENNDYEMVVNLQGYVHIIWNQEVLGDNSNVFFQEMHPLGTKGGEAYGRRLGSEKVNQYSPALGGQGGESVFCGWLEVDYSGKTKIKGILE